MINEHVDTINNLKTVIDIIKEDWNSPDDYWHIDITIRRKDVINNKIFSPYFSKITKDGEVKYFTRANKSNDDRTRESTQSKNFVGYAIISGNTLEEAIKSLLNPTVYFTSWAGKAVGMKTYSSNDGNMGAIIDVCTQFFARAYISMNKRSYRDVTKRIRDKYSKDYGIDSFLFSKESQRKLMGNEKFIKRPWSLIDFDIDDEMTEKEFEEYLKNNGVKIRYKLKSHNGTHYLLNYKDLQTARKVKLDLDKFDIRNMTFGIRGSGDKAVSIDHDNKLLLYSPCGRNYDLNNEFIKHNTMQISEADIRYMVMECVKNILNEAIEINMRDNGTIGSKGMLRIEDLKSPKDIFKVTIKKLNQYKKEVKNGLKVNIYEYFKDDDGFQIWKNYVKSMTGVDETAPVKTRTGRQKKGPDGQPLIGPKLDSVKRIKVRDEEGNVVFGDDGKPKFEEYPKEAIDFEYWVKNLVKERSLQEFGGNKSRIYAYEVDGSYLFGYYGNFGYGMFSYPVFIANSFASKDGQPMKIIKSICEYNNVVFSVSMDLASMLIKMGLYYEKGTEHSTKFGKRVVRKLTLATSPQIAKIAALSESGDLNISKLMSGNLGGLASIATSLLNF